MIDQGQVQVQIQVLHQVKCTTNDAEAVIAGNEIQVFQVLLDSAGTKK